MMVGRCMTCTFCGAFDIKFGSFERSASFRNLKVKTAPNAPEPSFLSWHRPRSNQLKKERPRGVGSALGVEALVHEH